MKTFVKDIDFRENRIVKMGNAVTAIGEIKHQQDIFVLTFGQFSLVDALYEIIRQIGSCDVDICVWNVYHKHLEGLRHLKDSMKIRRFRMCVDLSFEGRNVDCFRHMQKVFGGEYVRAIRNHAKFIVARNSDWNIVILTSMNLNENPRLEYLQISENKEFTDFFIEMMDGFFERDAEGTENRSISMLDHLDDSFPCPEVAFGTLDLSNVVECSTTHVIKKMSYAVER